MAINCVCSLVADTDNTGQDVALWYHPHIHTWNHPKTQNDCKYDNLQAYKQVVRK